LLDTDKTALFVPGTIVATGIKREKDPKSKEDIYIPDSLFVIYIMIQDKKRVRYAFPLPNGWATII
jgi:hypothetical protein